MNKKSSRQRLLDCIKLYVYRSCKLKEYRKLKAEEYKVFMHININHKKLTMYIYIRQSRH